MVTHKFRLCLHPHGMLRVQSLHLPIKGLARRFLPLHYTIFFASVHQKSHVNPPCFMVLPKTAAHLRKRCATSVFSPLSLTQRLNDLRPLHLCQTGIVLQNLGQFLAPLHSPPCHTAQQCHSRTHSPAPPNISAATSSSSSSKRISCVGCAVR